MLVDFGLVLTACLLPLLELACEEDTVVHWLGVRYVIIWNLQRFIEDLSIPLTIAAIELV